MRGTHHLCRKNLVSVLLASGLLTIFNPVRGLAATPRQEVDLRIDSLTVGAQVFEGVRIVSRDGRSVFFHHRGGLGSARLRELSPELQTRLGYDPLTAPPDESPPPAPVAVARKPAAPVVPERIRSAMERMRRLEKNFGTPAIFQPRQSMQDDFRRLNLTIKRQGPRPSCAAYAILSAMEYQYFQLHGQAADFSENYIIEMVRWMNGQDSTVRTTADAADGAPATEIGYTLPDVLRAIGTFGIALEQEMPPVAVGQRTGRLDRELIERSSLRRALVVARLPGQTNEAKLNDLVHTLNAGLPVPAGLFWPPHTQIIDGVLDDQPVRAGGGHAVTFVGYENPSGRPEDTVFVFKNSYGETWGQAGYGRATWRYLSHNLIEGYVLEVAALKNRF